MAAKKKLTNAEKKRKALVKKRLQAEGILPPDKPKLNRKQFVEEARQEWNDKDPECYTWDLYLIEAIFLMLGAKDKNYRVSQEAVGVAKALKLAIRLKEFSDKLKTEGRNTYTVGEKYEFIKDILDA